MTEMLNKEFSRRSFVKGGGALVVGFSLAGVGVRSAKALYLPDAALADSWITITSDNVANLWTSQNSRGRPLNLSKSTATRHRRRPSPRRSDGYCMGDCDPKTSSCCWPNAPRIFC